MEFWDAVSRGMDKIANRLDAISDRTPNPETEFSVMNKDYCWEDLDYAGDLTLQRHVVSGECRIIDRIGTVVDRGTQAELEQSMVRRAAKFAVLQEQQTANVTVGAELTEGQLPVSQPVQAQYGDIIGVIRRGGAYEHYGIYVSDTCIVHYGIPASQAIGHASIHATNLRNFLKADSEYFILDFPRPYQPPVRLGAGAVPHNETNAEELARHLQQTYGYHLYTPEETVARARSRLGETSYNLFTNNCEHFAIWCKTGVNESLQVSGMFQTLLKSRNWQFRKPMLY